MYAQDMSYASNSVLSNGKWIKIKIRETGIYKVTHSDLKKMGFNDPDKVAVCGYGGWILNEDFSKSDYMDDVPVISIWKENDSFLFYAKGSIKWEYTKHNYHNDIIEHFVHTNNPYAEYGCYFLTDAVAPKIMQTISTPEEGAQRITTFDDYFVYEKDEISVNKSGRELYGERMTGPTLDVDLGSIPGLADGYGFAECCMISKVTVSNTVGLSINKNLVGQSSFPINDSIYVKATKTTITGKWQTEPNAKIKVKIDYSQKNPVTTYLDYIRLNFKRELRMYDTPFTLFRDISSATKTSRYVIQNANANTLVFDVTDGIDPQKIETKLTDNELSFFARADGVVHEYVAVQKDKLSSAINETDAVEITNQDLHGSLPADMVIISPPAFKKQARRLADVHRDKDGLDILVATPEEIYNEFSSGTPDATAYRRLMKMLYDRSKSNGKPPKYLLLFGDGSYDNRFISNEWKRFGYKQNMLLTYQTHNSLTDKSFVVDDYFGFLEEEEGFDIGTARLAIGIGRFPVRTMDEATRMVDKVIKYMNSQNGSWKNNVCFVADDGNNDDKPKFTTLHQTDARDLAYLVERNRPEYITSKILFDRYKKDAGSGKYPGVEKEIQRQLNNGLFLINYTGHGNSESWSDEKVLTMEHITGANHERLPIWITATCDFCPFDGITTSAGENVFLNKESGGIALFTTSRVAFRNINYALNQTLLNNMFSPERGADQTLGDLIKEAKNKINSLYDRDRILGFSLIGDPALKLTYPEYNIHITSVNGNPISNDTVQFKANDIITLQGNIVSPTGTTVNNFNGNMDIKVFDSRQTIKTLGNNEVDGNKRIVTFDDYMSPIFSAKNIPVNEGLFKITFKVQKDISYVGDKPGKISMYAYDATADKEAAGWFSRYKVKGTVDNPETDNDPPEIRGLYLNDTTFVDGDKVNKTPLFYARLWDKSGINASGSGVGHDIVLRINNDPNLTFYLNDYYELLYNTDGEGTIQYGLPELPAGKHTATFTVWDVVNNSKTDTFTFEVIEDLKPDLYKIQATPNPAKSQVEFRLSHNRPESRINVEIAVYDLSGRIQWRYKESGSSRLFTDYIVSWNLTNGSGARLRAGVYLYQATISTKNSKETTKAEKMIILSP